MNTMNFNINHNVQVKLTNVGHGILKRNHIQLCDSLKKERGYSPPKEIDGWSTWQMWSLMETFGAHISLTGEVPFETEIKIEVK